MVFCLHCGTFRESGRFCSSCGKTNETELVNGSPNGTTETTAQGSINIGSPLSSSDRKKKKDVVHCTTCHLPKAGHTCSQIPCLDANACGKPRLHKKQGNRGYHDDKIITLLPTNPMKIPLDDVSVSDGVNDESSPKRQKLDISFLAEQIALEEQRRRVETEKSRKIIEELAGWLLGLEPTLQQTDEGKLIALKIASNTYNRLQSAKKSLLHQPKRSSTDNITGLPTDPSDDQQDVQQDVKDVKEEASVEGVPLQYPDVHAYQKEAEILETQQ